MSQRAVEATLGKLICDDRFRRAFYEDPEGAAVQAGFLLTPIELTSLLKVGVEAIEWLARHLDDRVRWAEDSALKARSKQRSGAS